MSEGLPSADQPLPGRTSEEFPDMISREAYINQEIERQRGYADTQAGLALNPIPGSHVTPEEHAKRAVSDALGLNDVAEQAGLRYDRDLEMRRDSRDAQAWFDAVVSETPYWAETTLEGLRQAVKGGNAQVVRMLADLERAARDVSKPSIYGQGRREEQLAALKVFSQAYSPFRDPSKLTDPPRS